MRAFLFLFLLFPVIELALLIQVGSAIGVLPTLLLVIGTAILGSILLRVAGVATAWRAREKLARGELSAAQHVLHRSLAETNFRLLREQASLLEMGYPLLIGWSRKSSLGALTGRPVGERLAASLSAALAGVQRGAHIVRVHDVAETVDALKVWAAAGLPDPLA